jgi:hypothetical protein
MREHSNYPMRSARLGAVVPLGFVNNRAEFAGPRGTYKIQAVVAGAAPNSVSIFFAIGRGDFTDYFGNVPAVATCAAECLPVSGPYSGTFGAGNTCHGGAGVEVDISTDGDKIHFWSSTGTEYLKIVRVGDLPSQDRQLDGPR